MTTDDFFVHRAPRKRVLTAAAGLAGLSMLVPHAAFASVATTPDDTVQVAGQVLALVQVGDRTIIGGKFTSVGGKPRQNIAAITADGKVDPTFDPGANGSVEALAASGDGTRIFVGGVFTQAGGLARANLAAVDATTGAGVTTWSADTVGTSPDVKSLATSGGMLYVGGKFGTIDGEPRGKLAAVDTATGDVYRPFRPRPAGGVRELVVSPDGTMVYAGGGFTALGGAERLQHAGAVFTADGNATPFAPTESGGNIVTVELSPDGSRFFFSTDNNTVFAYDPAQSNQPRWLHKMSGNTQAMAATATELYIGGHFSQSTTFKIKRAYFASLHPTDGTLTGWDPLASGAKMGVWALETTPTKLLAGGVFSKFGANGEDAQRGFARFSGTPAP